MELTELPSIFPGQIFRSAMPYSSYDPEGELIPAYKINDISLIVVLASDDECIRVTGRNLRAEYKYEGLEVIYLPIPDFGVPDMVEIRESISLVLSNLKSGEGVAIHCHAGVGRTGMYAACLAKIGMQYSSDEALGWVRRFLPGAVEVQEQEQLVRQV